MLPFLMILFLCGSSRMSSLEVYKYTFLFLHSAKISVEGRSHDGADHAPVLRMAFTNFQRCSSRFFLIFIVFSVLFFTIVAISRMRSWFFDMASVVIFSCRKNNVAFSIYRKGSSHILSISTFRQLPYWEDLKAWLIVFTRILTFKYRLGRCPKRSQYLWQRQERPQWQPVIMLASHFTAT